MGGPACGKQRAGVATKKTRTPTLAACCRAQMVLYRPRIGFDLREAVFVFAAKQNQIIPGMQASSMTEKTSDYIELAADIVSAYVSNNTVAGVRSAGPDSRRAQRARNINAAPPAPVAEPLKPAVNARKSVHDDFIICLEDGKKFKSLKRHLRTQYNMTPEQYREKWGLPADYPMVGPITPRPARRSPRKWVWARRASAPESAEAPLAIARFFKGRRSAAFFFGRFNACAGGPS